MSVTIIRRGLLPSLLAALILVLMGCNDEFSGDFTVSHRSSLLPNWSIEELTGNADIAVIGTVGQTLDTRFAPINSSENPGVGYSYTTVLLNVEDVVHPGESLASEIAVLLEPSVVSSDASVTALQSRDIPGFEAGERVMVFLEKVHPSLIEDGVVSVPDGFTSDTYFRTLVTARYGKLLPAGNEWRDSRSGEEVRLAAVESGFASSN
ncbi:MAG: hypothetical protein WD208_08180 [Dehalococcoidia bacterium]